MRALSLLGCFALLLLVSTEARASRDYPRLLQSRLALNYQPDCALCHSTPEGSEPKVVTEFGFSMVAFGLRANDAASLDAALRASLAASWDSDGDGLTDVDELVLNTDPSGPALSRVPGPTYGCSIDRRKGSSANVPRAMALLILIGLCRLLRKAKG